MRNRDAESVPYGDGKNQIYTIDTWIYKAINSHEKLVLY